MVLLFLVGTIFGLVAKSEALRCYSCSFSYNEMYDIEHKDSWCANESLVQYDTIDTSKICAPWERYCVTSIDTINKAFTSVSRGCGERCSELCESVGYGQDQNVSLIN
ncbi:hypothetical protein WR25_20251 [Diploscapter pachys]|uniref:Uncharacterized protein n=1 Tax=Diploscapter pachys TaxID=2018661 RepID=A0A2A2LPJ7_9BILA|nr:hypothetical protein WR25_20251 [Diploscapter pachys]